eukprot:664814-Ditylum_brightwellii.AAC.1
MRTRAISDGVPTKDPMAPEVHPMRSFRTKGTSCLSRPCAMFLSCAFSSRLEYTPMRKEPYIHCRKYAADMPAYRPCDSPFRR